MDKLMAMSDQELVEQSDISFNFEIIKFWLMISVRALDVRCAGLADTANQGLLTILTSPMPWWWSQIACTEDLNFGESVVRCLIFVVPLL